MSFFMKIRQLILIAPFLFSPFTVTAQQDIKIDKKEFNIEEQGFKEAWEYVKEGNKYFKTGLGTYGEALKNYERATDYNKYNPQLNYKMGVCCLFSEKKAEALTYFRKAFEFKNDVASDIHLMLGRSYHSNHRFDEAMEEYRLYLDNLTEKEKKKSGPDIEKRIKECENGKALLENMISVAITNIGQEINSPYDDYNPLITSTGNRMYFTSRRENPANDRRNFFDYKFNEDIYVSFYRNGKWEPAQSVGKSLNTEYSDAALAITDEDAKMYIYYGSKNNGDIYVSKYKKGKWAKPKKISGKFNSKFRETTISFTADGSAMYFISSLKKTTLGGSDVYVSYLNEKGKWDKVQNLGPVINTPYDEESVYIHPDGKTLYFSSKGHNSMGGFDIFKTTLQENTEWSEPVNLGYPINSACDDLFYSTYQDTTSAYLSSMREDSYGLMDIYEINYLPETEFVYTIPEAEEYPEVELELLTFMDDVPVLEKNYSFLLKGRITDSEDTIPLLARLEIIDMDLNEVIATSISSRENGTYSIRLEEKKDYGVEITCQGYMVFLDIIGIPSDSEESEFIKDFTLQKVRVGEKVILKNIFFELNKATLTPASYEELGRVLKLLESNPTLRIEISGHTDNIGSYQVNQRLSEARAKAVVDYLVGNGVDASRLEYAGYAFSQPVATNDTDEGRAQNRRVEFKILSK